MTQNSDRRGREVYQKKQAVFEIPSKTCFHWHGMADTFFECVVAWRASTMHRQIHNSGQQYIAYREAWD